jgi:hypothetical protein
MTQLGEFASPMVGRAAGLNADEARAQPGEEGAQVASLQGLLDDHPASCINGMNLENGLGQVDPDGGNLFNGRCSSDDVFNDNHLGALMPP